MNKSLALLFGIGLFTSGVSASTTTTTGTATLQWAGTVPQAQSGAGFHIVPTDSVAGLTGGRLVFKNDGSTISLSSSTEVGFKVVKDEDTTDGTYDKTKDITNWGYKYKLTNLKVGIDGAPTVVKADEFFGLYPDGDATAMATNAEKTKGATDSPVLFKIATKKNGTTPTALKSGSNVTVHAVISVESGGAI